MPATLSEYVRILFKVDGIKLHYRPKAASSEDRCYTKWRRSSEIGVVSRLHITRIQDAQHSPPTTILELLWSHLLSRGVPTL